MNKVYEITKSISAKIHKIHLNKLQNLNRQKQQRQSELNSPYEEINENQFYTRVYNTSDILFNSKELSLLEKGPKYCPKFKNTKKDSENLAIDLELSTNDQGTKYILNKIIKGESSEKTVKDRDCSNNEWKIIKTIKNKVKENGLVITKADKGNTLVITPTRIS